MTPGARLTAGLLLAVVAVSVGYLFKQSTAGPDEYLFGAEPLTTAQITAIEGAVGKAGLSGHTVEGNRIRVPRMKKGDYMGAILDAGALPRGVMDYMQEGLDSGGWTDSRAVKQARLKASRERQLSHLIQMMPWVSQASVLYSEEKLPGLNAGSRVAATAAVQPIPGESVDTGRARTIKNLVAGWHPSLSVDGVTVIDQSDNSSFRGGEMAAGDFNDPYYQTLVAFENHVRSNIMRRLSYIPGVRVQVSATLDPRLNSQVRSTEVKKDPLVRNVTEVSETTSQNTVDGAGRPGLVAQGPRRPDEEGPRRTNQSEVNNTRNEEASVFPDTRTFERLAGLVPKEVQASVGVPRDFIVDLWKKQQAALGEVPDKVDPQQLQTIESQIIRDLNNSVEPLLPDPPGAQDEYKKVHVVVFDTVDAEPLPEPSVASDALFFASEHAGTAGMIVLGVVGLMMLRSVVNNPPTGGDSTGLSPTLQLHTGDGATGGGASDGSSDSEEDGPKLQLKKPESLKDDLASLVREDPDAAAAILRGWIGSAG